MHDELASSLLDAGNGIEVLTGGTDVHLVLVDLRASELSGQDAEDRLAQVSITVNRNAIPFDPRPPRVTSGLRIGSPAMVTRGLGTRGLPRDRRDHRPSRSAPTSKRCAASCLSASVAIVERYPLYAELGAHATV